LKKNANDVRDLSDARLSLLLCSFLLVPAQNYHHFIAFQVQIRFSIVEKQAMVNIISISRSENDDTARRYSMKDIKPSVS